MHISINDRMAYKLCVLLSYGMNAKDYYSDSSSFWFQLKMHLCKQSEQNAIFLSKNGALIAAIYIWFLIKKENLLDKNRFPCEYIYYSGCLDMDKNKTVHEQSGLYWHIDYMI